MFNYIVLERCRVWMNDPDIHTYRHSVLEVLSPMLERRMNWAGMDGRWLSHGSFPLPPEPLRELRHGALELVERYALSGEGREVLGALHTLHTPVSEAGLWGLRNEDPTEWQAWEEETLAALEIVARVAEKNDDPFVRLRIWEELHLQAKCGPRPAAQRRAREILEMIPHPFECRFILLLTGGYGWAHYRQTWTHPGEGDDDWLKADQATRLLIDQKRYRRNVEFARQVTLEWVELHPDPGEGFDALDEWIKRIEESGWWKEFWTRSNPFMLQLAADYPSYARAWCEIAIGKPEARTTEKCDDLLCELRRQDQEEALKLAQLFLKQDHPNLWLRVAGSYAWRGWPTEPLREEWQIVRDLLAFPHPQVKRSAAGIVSAIASTDMGRAMEIVLETDIGDDSQVADALFEIFEERRGLIFGAIESDDLERLLDKLSTVESIRSYHLGRFLLQAALRAPVAVARILLGRVRRKIHLDKERIEKPVADTRLQLFQTRDSFGGLPESGFHDERFQEVASHPDYRDALRLIRDASLNEEYRWGLMYEDTLSELFRHFSLNFSPESLEVMNEWIDSGDCVKVRAAVYLLGDT